MSVTGAEPMPPPSEDSKGLLQLTWARFGTIVRELSKFGTVGSVAFCIDVTVFNVLLQRGAEPLTAKSVATVLAATVAFTGHRLWTWRHRERRNLAREYTLFIVLNTVGLGIGLACLAISHYGLGAIWPALRRPIADNISGQLVGTALGTLFRFWSYRRFVFRESAVGEPGDVAVPIAEHRPVM